MGKGQTELSKRFVEAAGFQVPVRSPGEGGPVVVLPHSTGPFWSEFYDRLAEAQLVHAEDMPVLWWVGATGDGAYVGASR
jgi:hypothetical protein